MGSHFGSLWAPGGHCKTIKKRVSVVHFHTLAPSGWVCFSSLFLGGVCLHVFLAFGALLAPLLSPRVGQGTEKGARGGPKRPPNSIKIGDIFPLGPRRCFLVDLGYPPSMIGVPPSMILDLFLMLFATSSAQNVFTQRGAPQLPARRSGRSPPGYIHIYIHIYVLQQTRCVDENLIFSLYMYGPFFII